MRRLAKHLVSICGKNSYHRLHINAEVMHAWMRADIAGATGRIGLDIGAGKLANRRFFNTDKYIAIEPHLPSATQGRERYPDATIHICRAEEFEPEEPVDVALACTVIGNKRFDNERTVKIIEQIIGWIAPGGSLFFDIRPRVIGFEKEIDALLSRSFRSVEKKPFGRFRILAPTFITAPAGFFLSRLPAINETKNPAKRSVYYACRGKVANPS